MKSTDNKKIIIANQNLTGAQKTSTVKPMTIDYFISQRNNFNFSPPYQRGEVWKPRRRQRLIESILSNWPINTIHVSLITKGSKTMYNIVDGKQRLSTLLNFVDSKHSSGIYINKGFGNVSEKPMNFKTIVKEADGGNAACSEILATFREYALNIVVHKNLNINQEKELFDRINESEPLNINEKIFGSNYKTSFVFRYILDKYYLQDLECMATHNMAYHVRAGGVRVLAEMLLLSFGENFSDNFDYRVCKNPEIEKLSKKMEKNIEEITIAGLSKDEVDIRISEMFSAGGDKNLDKEREREYLEIIESLIGKKNFEDFRSTVKCLSIIFNRQKGIKNKSAVEKGWVTDCFCWAMKNVQSEVLTIPFVNDNWEEIKNFLVKDYKIGWRDTPDGQAQKMKGGDRKPLRKRIEKMEELFTASGLDTDKKNKKLSSKAVQNAILLSDGIDKYTNVFLHSAGVDVDHINPKSRYSDSGGAEAISQFSNRSMGNKTK